MVKGKDSWTAAEFQKWVKTKKEPVVEKPDVHVNVEDFSTAKLSKYVIDVAPMAAPRMTRKDKWSPRPVVERYWKYKDDVRDACNKVGYTQGDSLDIVFIVKTPDSWSNKRTLKFLGRPHKSRPDNDNMIKAWLDAHLEEDAHVWDVKSLKIWGIEGKILIGCYDEVKQRLYSGLPFTLD